MAKKYAFIDYGGQVLSIETRCSCIYRKDKRQGELSIEDIVHPDFVGRYQEIPDGAEVTEGMIFSNGEFKENPAAPGARVDELENRVSATEDAVLALMMQ